MFKVKCVSGLTELSTAFSSKYMCVYVYKHIHTGNYGTTA